MRCLRGRLRLDTRKALQAAERHRYQPPVFFAGPWAEINTTDHMRKATWAQAERFYSEVFSVYERLGYEMVELPKASIEDRAAFVRQYLR